MRVNSRVILVQDGCVALIWCDELGEQFYVFPGGGVEPGETTEEAAIREAEEELGVVVALTRVVATYRTAAHYGHFYLARQVSGTFGMGTGPEYIPGRYPNLTMEPRWVPLDLLPSLDVRPQPIARALAAGVFDRAREPLHVVDD